MFPREHLPLTLVTIALLGLLFLLFREINAVKSAVSQASVPPALHASILPIENDTSLGGSELEEEQEVAKVVVNADATKSQKSTQKKASPS